MPSRNPKPHKFTDKDRAKSSGAAKGGRATARGRDKMTLDEVRQKNHEDMAEELRKLGR